jgi:hypothetical protein
VTRHMRMVTHHVINDQLLIQGMNFAGVPATSSCLASPVIPQLLQTRCGRGCIRRNGLGVDRFAEPPAGTRSHSSCICCT